MKSKRIYSIITVLSLIVLFTSCDNREFNDINNAPSLTINHNGEELESLSARVKISLKSGIPYLSIRLTMNDENGNISNLSFTVDGDVIVKKDGNETSSIIDIAGNNGYVDIEIYPQSSGNHVLNFVLEDSFGEASSVNLNLEAFINDLPIAHYEANRVQLDDPRHYVIDASESYDQDASLGGGLVEYEYTIEGIVISQGSETSEPDKLDWIFGSSGNKEVRVRVKDSDGEWSDYYTGSTVSIN